MKNLLKIAAVALVIATVATSCDPSKSSTETVKKDSVKVDSAKKDTTSVITTEKKDTVKK